MVSSMDPLRVITDPEAFNAQVPLADGLGTPGVVKLKFPLDWKLTVYPATGSFCPPIVTVETTHCCAINCCLVGSGSGVGPGSSELQETAATRRHIAPRVYPIIFYTKFP